MGNRGSREAGARSAAKGAARKNAAKKSAKKSARKSAAKKTGTRTPRAPKNAEALALGSATVTRGQSDGSRTRGEA